MRGNRASTDRAPVEPVYRLAHTEPMQLHLTAALKYALTALDAPAQEGARRAVLREAKRIRDLPPGALRAQGLHDRLDAGIQAFLESRPDLAGAIRCGKGCAHCCRIFVGITGDEARLLAQEARAGRASLSEPRLEIQRHWDSPADFATHSREETACVFLQGDGSCGVYEHRPSACRALLVASDPEGCRQAGRSTRILAIINPSAEGLVSAARTADALETGAPSHPLARRLWEALQR